MFNLMIRPRKTRRRFLSSRESFPQDIISINDTPSAQLGLLGTA